MSDFLDDHFEDALKVAGKKHDVIGVKVYDKMDMQLPDIGMMEIEDTTMVPCCLLLPVMYQKIMIGNRRSRANT